MLFAFLPVLLFAPMGQKQWWVKMLAPSHGKALAQLHSKSQ